MKALGFFHKSDNDGKLSGAILKMAIPDIQLIGIDHGDPFPWELIDSGTIVYMADFSLPEMPDMIKIWDISKRFFWFDHHKSAIEKYCDYINSTEVARSFVLGRRDVLKSGCELTWEYLFPDKNIPDLVTIVGSYDTWRDHGSMAWVNRYEPFQYGSRLLKLDPSTDAGLYNWKLLLENERDVSKIIDKGYTIMDYLKQVNRDHAKRYSYDTVIDGHPAIAMNTDTHSSSILDGFYDPNKHDLMITYTYDPNDHGWWYISFYSTKPEIDCSIFAGKRGGGGHRGAAGCRISRFEKLPWNLE
jgi:uncharacterized protein